MLRWRRRGLIVRGLVVVVTSRIPSGEYGGCGGCGKARGYIVCTDARGADVVLEELELFHGVGHGCGGFIVGTLCSGYFGGLKLKGFRFL
jgi:hypothetical protein